MIFKNADLEQCMNKYRTDLELFVQERTDESIRNEGYIQYRLRWAKNFGRFTTNRTELFCLKDCFLKNRLISCERFSSLNLKTSVEDHDISTKQTLLYLSGNIFYCEDQETSDFLMSLILLSDLFKCN